MRKESKNPRSLTAVGAPTAPVCGGISAAETNPRLEPLARLEEGLAIAEADCADRGPGDLLGQPQHGAFRLRDAALSEAHAATRSPGILTSVREPWISADGRLLPGG